MRTRNFSILFQFKPSVDGIRFTQQFTKWPSTVFTNLDSFSTRTSKQLR